MSRLRRVWTPWRAAVWMLILAYFAFFSTLTVRRHNAFQSTAFDLGNVDQAVWNTRHGRPFAMTNIEGLTSRLGTHVEPILPSLALLYFLFADPRALLVLQTAVIALGAWPVYLLVERANGKGPNGQMGNGGASNSILALSFSLAYLMFPALQSANLCDFHALALAPTLFLLSLYCLETEQWSGLAFFSVLTAFCKEDMSLLVVMLGVYAMVVHRRWRIGLLMVVLAGAWFTVATGWILPRFDTGGVSPLANRYAYLGDSPLEIAVSPITRFGMVAEQLLTAENAAYLRDLFMPVAYLPILAPQVLILAAPTLAVNLLSTETFMHQLEGGYYYGAPLVPIVVISAAYSASWLMRRLSRLRFLQPVLAAIVLVTTLLYHRNHGYTPLAADFRRYRYVVDDHDRLGSAMAHRIPPDASLTTLARLNPHASQRQQLYAIYLVENGLPAFIRKTDYIWLDVTNSWPLHPSDLKASVDNLLAMGYGVEQAADGWVLLRFGGTVKTLPDAFYDFARTSDPKPQRPARLQFLLEGRPALECLGLDWSWHPDGLQLTFFWRALQPLPPGLQLVLFYIEDTANPAGETSTLQPLIAPVWYPPDRWQARETVVASTVPWPVDSDFTVGLGVVQGDDWGSVDQRLPILIEPSAPLIRLLDGDTWACLLHVRGGEPVRDDCTLVEMVYPGGMYFALSSIRTEDSPAQTLQVTLRPDG